jgi:N-carbamoyl-L-amino-acid hydrolase
MRSHPLGNLRVDADRLLGRLAALAKIGSTGDGGVRRLALSEEDRQGRDQLCAWIRETGLKLHVDRIGNILGVLAGETDGPVVMLGSHIDTVATGGKYDGALGVVAGLEALATLKDAGVTPKRPMAVMAFTGEEGARFAPDLLGSCVWTGDMTAEEAYASTDVDGVTAGEAIRAIGYVGALEPGAVEAHAYLELHIEQGPVLHAEGGGLAAVTGVQAITWLEAVVEGEPNHAGTTPMAYRRDATYAASRIVVAARETTRDIEGQVANVGRFTAAPGNVNVVANRVTMTIDIRNPSNQRLAEAEARVRAAAAEVAASERVTVTFRDLARFPAQAFDEGLVRVVEEAARDLGHRVRRMPSGAGHDAQMMATVAPTAMIFVPTRDGKSHTPEEHAEAADIVAGANVLLAAALRVAQA